jgi:hypothetical protein
MLNLAYTYIRGPSTKTVTAPNRFVRLSIHLRSKLGHLESTLHQGTSYSSSETPSTQLAGCYPSVNIKTIGIQPKEIHSFLCLMKDNNLKLKHQLYIASPVSMGTHMLDKPDQYY